MMDFDNWNKQEKAIAESHPIFWRDFFEFCFSEKHDLSKYIFRGHTKESYELESTFARECRKLHKDTSIPNWKQHLANFRLAIRGRIKMSQTELNSDEEIWAIGQHHGLATPLLDWTESPFVAAFFAFHEKQSEPVEQNRAIFGINSEFLNSYYDHAVCAALRLLSSEDPSESAYQIVKEQVQTLFESGNSDHENRIKIEKIAQGEYPAEPNLVPACRQAMEVSLTTAVKIVKPLSGENSRLVNQKGLFTYFLRSTSLKGMVDEILPQTEDFSKPDPILVKFVLKDSERDKVLKSLSQMNITYASLFPDLFGSSKYCNSIMNELPETL